jgi:predicted NBD/HSP70 family sugar kinase/mannose-6-phosphate isomerase class I
MSEHMNKELFLGVDIGGSHISSGLVDSGSGLILQETIRKTVIDANGDCFEILNQWTHTLRDSLNSLSDYRLAGIGVAIPGPFNYEQGISLMNGVSKYASLFGVSIKDAFKQKLLLKDELPIVFENDAACFGIGESLSNGVKKMRRVMAITLGTGFGSTFLEGGKVVKFGKGVPRNGELYNIPYLEGVNEDYISSNWILSSYNGKAVIKATSVKIISERAIIDLDPGAIDVFKKFGIHLASCMKPWIKSFKADCIIIGGSIAKSSQLFINELISELSQSGFLIPIKISEHMEMSAIKGAASLITKDILEEGMKYKSRKSNQPLLPIRNDRRELIAGEYDMYPHFSLGADKIFIGYASLADWLMTKEKVMIDGIMGNDWNAIQSALSEIFKQRSVTVQWYSATAFQHPPETIEKLTDPFIGKIGDVWGTKCTLNLGDMFNTELLSKLKPASKADIHIIIGTGAAFANWDDLIYFDLPKNEIQFRMRAGQEVSIVPCKGLSNPEIYKRLYFVDWIINRRHREAIQQKIKVIVDGQWTDTISWAFSQSIYEGFKKMATTVIRARPWFEPGAWGGQWLKNKIKGISPKEVNYAWSFELIAPENGLIFESDNNQLEVAFDWLMEQQAPTILGEAFARFGNEFPIRFDYLDTMDGGNLSIQCHPSLSYIKSEFGESITQDETYYILDCKDDAQVYLGFQENIEPDEFKQVLEDSADNNVPVDITKYVQVHPAKKHDLFLIPNQTVHSAGRNNMVLEISATPYIFTFKMYDWLRLDLEGNPRPINIEHAFNNLNFSRKGEVVKRELISKEQIIESNNNYKIVHLPTHSEHFYDVHRIEFSTTVEIDTYNKCFVMMLVEGQSILVTVEGKKPMRFNYAETFIAPAGVRKFTITNETQDEIKIIKAFVK